MKVQPFFLIAALVLMVSNGAGAQPVEDVDPDPARLMEEIEDARQSPEKSYHLEVECADQERVRSLELFASGVGIWNRRAQFLLPVAKRQELLEILLRERFSYLAPHYGGRTESEEPGAALRVICRVELDLDVLRKSSVQFGEGEQSPQLAALAAALLDVAEPHAADGTVANSLEDGLRKLAAGTLTPDGFGLRFVELPRSREETGAILRLEGSSASVQPYAPGREVGESVARALDADELEALVTALIEAGVWGLPVNLWAEDHLEIEVSVLDQRKSVIARRFSRLESQRSEEAQRRLDRLLEVLRTLRGS